MSEQWPDYVRRIAGSLTQVQIAQQTGIAQTNAGRWLRGAPGQPRADSVITFARSFGQNPIEALIAAGYLTPEEAGARTVVRTPLSEYTNAELSDEVKHRMDSTKPATAKRKTHQNEPGLVRTRSEAAQYLRMSMRRLDELIRSGQIAAVRDGRSVKITASELDRYISELPAFG